MWWNYNAAENNLTRTSCFQVSLISLFFVIIIVQLHCAFPNQQHNHTHTKQYPSFPQHMSMNLHRVSCQWHSFNSKPQATHMTYSASPPFCILQSYVLTHPLYLQQSLCFMFCWKYEQELKLLSQLVQLLSWNRNCIS